ncbi:MAG: arsenate reductase family protein [Chitinophagales bacterium]
MRKKVYHLATCSTNQRILKEAGIGEEFEHQNIKVEKISPEQLEEMKKLSGSYESLFSRRARKYRLLELNKKELGEEDYKNYILEEYTFLKRPIFLVGDQLFFGSMKKSLESLKETLGK